MTQRVVASKDQFFGSATCLMAHPLAFDLDDDNVVVIMEGERDLSDEDRYQVSSNCPGGALDVVEID